MNILEIRQLIADADACNHVPLIIGKHGIGKSDIVRTYAAQNNLHCEVLITSLMDEGDLAGIPRETIIDGIPSTAWASPDWFSRIMSAHAQGKRSVLFLDEFNRSSVSIMNVCLQLILDKRLHSHVLPEGTLIVAAINPADGEYSVLELDPAVLDRMVVCEIEPDARSWLSYANTNNLHPTIIDFITKNPNKLHVTPKDGGKGASPRSWSRLSTYLTTIENYPTQPSTFTYYLRGTIGESLAAEFLMFYNNYTKSVSVKEVVANYKESAKKLLSFADITASMEKLIAPLEAIQKAALAEQLASELLFKPKQADRKPYLVYLYALPLEILAGYLKGLANAPDKTAYNALVVADEEFNNKGLFRRVIVKKAA